MAFAIAPAATADSDLAGTWTYQDGMLTSTHVFQSDGSAEVPANANLRGQWSIEGDRFTVKWNNGWTCVFQLPVVSGRVSGLATGPDGDTHRVSLTRRASVPNRR